MPSDDDKLKVYLAHRAALIHYATPLTGSRAAAEDVVQDAWFRFDQAQSARQPAAYLYRIVRNLALDLTRRLNLELRYQDSSDVTATPWLAPSTLPEPEQTLIDTDQLEHVAAALEDLPDTARQALELHRLSGMRLEDIARTLDVSVSTAQRLVHQSLLKVAMELDRRNRSATADDEGAPSHD